MPRPTILLTSTLDSPFIDDDFALLSRHFSVSRIRGHGAAAALRIATRARSADLTFTWFASTYAFAATMSARLSGRRSIIVVGGVDAARLPEIGYGLWLSPWKAPLAARALRTADRVLPVDGSLADNIRRLARYDGANVTVLPTGYDPDFWTPSGAKEACVLTVAGCDDPVRVKAKGLPFLMEAARRLPDVRFEVVGPGPGVVDALRRDAPPNLTLRPRVARQALLPFYRRAAVYCQPSYTEGLPNSVCEAMLCGCVPVGTRAGGIPTAMGGQGFSVEFGDAQGLASAVRAALGAPAGAGAAAREHIAGRFTLAMREAGLARIVGEVLA